MSTPAERSYRWLFWLLALVGLTVDQASKYGVFAWLYDAGRPNSRAVIPGRPDDISGCPVGDVT